VIKRDHQVSARETVNTTADAKHAAAAKPTDTFLTHDCFDERNPYLPQAAWKSVKWYRRFKGMSVLPGSALNERGGSEYLRTAGAKKGVQGLRRGQTIRTNGRFLCPTERNSLFQVQQAFQREGITAPHRLSGAASALHEADYFR
jgi:hypothetical protein